VYHVGICRGIDVDADSAGMFVAPAADIQNLFAVCVRANFVAAA